MDADGVPIVGQSLDLKLLEPLQHKRTLAYINHFIIQVDVSVTAFPFIVANTILLIVQHDNVAWMECVLLLMYVVPWPNCNANVG